MKKIVILGAGGQLGKDLLQTFPDAYAFYHDSSKNLSIDITHENEVSEKILRISPDVIINASALTNVDLCEKEKKLAFLVNGQSVKYIVDAARRTDAFLVHVSTDYIFDGHQGEYDEEAVPNPINYYGLSKLVGEIYANSYENSLILRTSGVYSRNNNFPVFVYNQLLKGNAVNAIKGYYSPIHSANLAKCIYHLVGLDRTGTLNVAGVRISRYEFARKIAEKFGFDVSLINEIENTNSMTARRPFDSSLNIEKAKTVMDFDFYSIESNLNLFSRYLLQ